MGLVVLAVPILAEWRRASDRPLVQSTVARADTVSLTLTATGTLVPALSVDVGSRVTGTLRGLYVGEGDVVRRGAVLARVVPDVGTSLRESAHAAILDARARVAAATADLQRRQQQLDRLRALSTGANQGVGVSGQDLEAAAADVAVAEATLQAARAEIVRAGAAVREADAADDRTLLLAPFDGVVTQVYRRPGEVVVPATYGGESGRILTLAKPDIGRITIPVPERYALQLDSTDKVTAQLLADPSHRLLVRVRRTRPRRTPDGGASGFEADVDVNSQGRSLPWGATALLQIVVSRSPAPCVVPLSALVLDPDGSSRVGLYILHGDRAEYRRVDIGQYGDSAVSIAMGISVGTTILIPPSDGLVTIRDGERVRLR